MRLLQEYENECKTKSSDEDLTAKDSSPSSPHKLPLNENHYSEGKAHETDNVPPELDDESGNSLIVGAKNKLFSFVKTAIDSLDILENDNETEDSSSSSFEKCSKSDVKNERESNDSSQSMHITMKEKGDMVVLGNKGTNFAPKLLCFYFLSLHRKLKLFNGLSLF